MIGTLTILSRILCRWPPRFLVYEHMALGSLEYHLLGTNVINSKPYPMSFGELRTIWYRNAIASTDIPSDQICPSWSLRVIYGDLKSSNILLDGEFNKSSKVGPTGGRHCAPEYARTGQLTFKAMDTTRSVPQHNPVTWAWFSYYLFCNDRRNFC